METTPRDKNTLTLRNLEGLETGYTRFLRVDSEDKTIFAESRRALLNWMGSLDSFDVLHLGGRTGTSKDGPADLMAYLIRQMDDEERILQFFSSGNTDLAIRRALISHGIENVLLHAYVNKGINPLILDRIKETVDNVEILNGKSPPPFENFFGNINPDIAHARHIYQAVLAGLRPNSIFVPVGSGALATEVIEASSGWIAIAKYLDSVGVELTQIVFDKIYPKVERCTNLDRKKELPGFEKFLDYMRMNYGYYPNLEELKELVPDVYLCGEEGLLLSSLREENGKWKIGVDIDGEYNESYGMARSRPSTDVFADKLQVPRVLNSSMRAFTGVMNLRPEKIRSLIIPGFKIMEAEGHAYSANIPCEPSSAVVLAGLRKAVREMEIREELGSILVLMSGRGSFIVPRQAEDRLSDISKPFKGWEVK